MLRPSKTEMKWQNPGPDKKQAQSRPRPQETGPEWPKSRPELSETDPKRRQNRSKMRLEGPKEAKMSPKYKIGLTNFNKITFPPENLCGNEDIVTLYSPM